LLPIGAFSVEVRHDQLGRQLKAGVIAVCELACSAPSSESARLARLSKRPHPLSQVSRFGVAECLAVHARLGVPWFQSRLMLSWCIWSVASVSANHATRLVTRTKESNMCASHWVAKPKGVIKVKVGFRQLRWDSWLDRDAPPSHRICLPERWRNAGCARPAAAFKEAVRRSGAAGGKSGLHRVGCRLMAGRGDSQESATENKPPRALPGSFRIR